MSRRADSNEKFVRDLLDRGRSAEWVAQASGWSVKDVQALVGAPHTEPQAEPSPVARPLASVPSTPKRVRTDRKPPESRVLRVAQLIAHPANVRESLTDIEELADSIREHGLLQPLTVTPHPTVEHRFLILAGHRRVRAAMLAGLVAVPCVVRDVTDRDDQVLLMLVENCQRVDLNPMEQALALGSLRDRGQHLDDMSRLTGKSVAWVSYRLGLLDLPPEQQQAIIDGTLKASHAEQLVRDQRKAERNGAERGAVWDPPHFATTHQLARKARMLCEGRGHGTRRQVGKVACGQCWERVIREDERTAIAVEHSMVEEVADATAT